MILRENAILGIRLRASAKPLRETNISSMGLICGYEKDNCFLGEIAREMRNEIKVKAEALEPMILKAYYTEKEYPKIPRLRINRKEHKEAHEVFRKSFVEIPVERETAFWLVRRVGFNKLRPSVVMSGTLSEIDLLANPMVDISKMMPLLEVRDGVLQMASTEKGFIIKLSKSIDDLRNSLEMSEIDLDALVQKISHHKRKELLKKIKELNKIIKSNESTKN